MTGHITVDYQVGELPAGIYEGAPFQVDLSYDTTTPDPYYSDDPQRGYYLTEVDFNNFLRFRAGLAEVIAQDLWLLVGNDIDGYAQPGDGRPITDLPGDSLQLQSQIIASFPVAPFNKISFRWQDPSQSAFDSDALPLQLNLSAFDDAWFEVSSRSLEAGVDQFIFRGVVTEIAKIPESPAFSTAALCLILMSGAARDDPRFCGGRAPLRVAAKRVGGVS